MIVLLRGIVHDFNLNVNYRAGTYVSALFIYIDMKITIIIISIIIGFIIAINNIPEDSEGFGTFIHIIAFTIFVGCCLIATPILMLLWILGIIE